MYYVSQLTSKNEEEEKKRWENKKKGHTIWWAYGTNRETIEICRVIIVAATVTKYIITITTTYVGMNVSVFEHKAEKNQ